ncbi:MULTISPECIES: DUF1194 domain-containing protein [unclassified Ensifer]|uniref:DUF1194 domain-containing protein n=1 Tax=unclassified Ensifer TaxID=2633371 RepID=UPI0008131AA7|nr:MULTISPECIES: DUF1194 domain-containing protein [unclassified Ensifer]OCP09270.1 hypothetical protein BC374_01490 [Ensifer sp. LC13]OCP10452.1 hypothetical protein BBX50_01840 [Ensifer sp. LC11]OCP13942.1 hypothetical protein BC362_04115 [Ensifer sp. LC14]OCP32518.1 hypothetical protein BC364_01490 [Ensifer sp. LC499]
MLSVLALILSLSGGPSPSTAVSTNVDVELILAVDMSGSMDLDEARVQRAGYVEALRHRDFLDAVESGQLGRIAIGYFEWAGTVNESSVVAWRVIDTAADADAFAKLIEARPVGTRRGTSISNAITYGTALIDSNAFAGIRRVIDISGDGPNNIGPPVLPARDTAIERGITINGLAILIRPSVSTGPLDQYYAECVIGGPGSFVLPVHEPEDFAVAIRQKLVLEVSGLPPPPRVRLVDALPASDCLIGEKLRPGFLDRVYPELDK